MSMGSLYEDLISSIYPALSGKETRLRFPQAAIDSLFLDWLKIEKNRKEVGVSWFHLEEAFFSEEEAKRAGAHYGNPSFQRVNVVIDGMHTAFLFAYKYNPISHELLSGITFRRAESYVGSHDAAKKVFEKFAEYLKSSISFEALSVRAMMIATGLQR